MEPDGDGNINMSQCARNSSQGIVEKAGGARGVMVIVVGNGHSDMSSNPVQG